MQVIPVPCLKDNYAYLVIDDATKQAAVVDPSEAAPVLEAVNRAGVPLIAIWNTHHHWDHTGGNKALVQALPKLTVVGHASDKGRVDGQTLFLNHGETFKFGSLTVRGLHNPGHTTGAISYAVEDAVFTGDTMFAAGCGRLFEGTPEQMYTSLCKTIGGLPETTRVFFGHEYTENNLRFAVHVEPDNAAAQARYANVQAARKAGKMTTPSTLKEEWATNPFMRTASSKTLQARAKQEDSANDGSPIAVLGVVRKLKDKF
ncbi:MAG TPA: hydroxyacylglutathione hydrolase [bacterium]